MIQCNTIAIHSSSFVRSAARSFVHAPSPSPSARARASRLARRLTLMVGRSSPRRRDDYGGGRHNTPVRDARPRTREPVSHRTTSIKNSHRRSASSSTSNRLARVASERIQSSDRANRSVVSRVDRTNRGERSARVVRTHRRERGDSRARERILVACERETSHASSRDRHARSIRRERIESSSSRASAGELVR